MTERDTIERAYKQKAGENYRVACLVWKTAPNAAANRVYYALYQAVIGEFGAKGLKPEVVDPIAKFGSDSEEKNKWRHSVVIKNGSLAGLTAREGGVVQRAYQLRLIADYHATKVNAATLESMLLEAHGLLEGLGVTV